MMHASDLGKRCHLSDKIKTLKAKHDSVANECASMGSAIGHLIQNPPQTPHTSSICSPTPPSLLQRALPPLPPPTPAESNIQLLATPSPSPVKCVVPPHMDRPAASEKVKPPKKKHWSSATSWSSSENECCLTRNVTSLQVTSQSMLEDEEMMPVPQDAFGKVKTMSTPPEYKPAHTDVENLSGPLEWKVMQPLNTTLPVSCVDYIESHMLNYVRRVQIGHSKTQTHIDGLFSFLFTVIIFLCFMQTASAMSFHASTLSDFVLTANGMVNPSKIAHINTAINTWRPHLFVISETKTNSRMSGKWPVHNYNIFEETSVKTDNHHLYKWGLIIRIQKYLQITQWLSLSHAALLGRVIAVDFVIGTSHGHGFVHRFIGAYTPWNPGGANSKFWNQVTDIFHQSQHSRTLAGDINTTVTNLECASGGQDAKDTTYSSYSVLPHRIYGWFTQNDRVIETGPADQEVHLMEVTLSTE